MTFDLQILVQLSSPLLSPESSPWPGPHSRVQVLYPSLEVLIIYTGELQKRTVLFFEAMCFSKKWDEYLDWSTWVISAKAVEGRQLGRLIYNSYNNDSMLTLVANSVGYITYFDCIKTSSLINVHATFESRQLKFWSKYQILYWVQVLYYPEREHTQL